MDKGSVVDLELHVGLFRAGTWHLSGGEEHEGPQVIHLKTVPTVCTAQ